MIANLELRLSAKGDDMLVNSFLQTLFFLAICRSTKVLVTLYALNHGLNDSLIGLFTTVFSVLPMALSIHVGRYLDRYGMKRTLAIGVMTNLASYLLVILFPNIYSCFIAIAITGLSTAIYTSVFQFAVSYFSVKENRVRNIGNFTLVTAAGAGLGTLVSGFVVDLIGFEKSFVASILTLLLASLALSVFGKWLINPHAGSTPKLDTPAKKVSHNSIFGAIPKGGGPVILVGSLAGAAAEIPQVYIPLIAHNNNFSSTAITTILSAMTFAGLFTRFIVAFLTRYSEAVLIRYSLIISSIGFVAFPFVHTVPKMFFCSLIVGLGVGMLQPLSIAAILNITKKDQVAEVLGARLMATYASRVATPLLLDFLSLFWGIHAAFYVTSAALGGFGGWFKNTGVPPRKEKLSQSEIDQIMDNFNTRLNQDEVDEIMEKYGVTFQKNQAS